MAYYQALQMHQYSPPDAMFKQYYPNLTRDVMFPIFIASQHAELTDSDAKEVRAGVLSPWGLVCVM